MGRKKTIQVIVLVLMIVFILLGSCTQSIQNKSITCDDDPSLADCICPGLLKLDTPYGYFCANESCSHCANENCSIVEGNQQYTFNGSCADHCPEGYTPFSWHPDDPYRYHLLCNHGKDSANAK